MASRARARPRRHPVSKELMPVRADPDNRRIPLCYATVRESFSPAADAISLRSPPHTVSGCCTRERVGDLVQNNLFALFDGPYLCEGARELDAAGLINAHTTPPARTIEPELPPLTGKMMTDEAFGKATDLGKISHHTFCLRTLRRAHRPSTPAFLRHSVCSIAPPVPLFTGPPGTMTAKRTAQWHSLLTEMRA